MGHLLSLACRSESKKKKSLAVCGLFRACTGLASDWLRRCGLNWTSTANRQWAATGIRRWKPTSILSDSRVVGCRHCSGDMLEGFWLRGRVCDWRENLAPAEEVQKLAARRRRGSGGDGSPENGWASCCPVGIRGSAVVGRWAESKSDDDVAREKKDDSKRKRHKRTREGWTELNRTVDAGPERHNSSIPPAGVPGWAGSWFGSGCETVASKKEEKERVK